MPRRLGDMNRSSSSNLLLFLSSERIFESAYTEQGRAREALLPALVAIARAKDRLADGFRVEKRRILGDRGLNLEFEPG